MSATAYCLEVPRTSTRAMSTTERREAFSRFAGTRRRHRLGMVISWSVFLGLGLLALSIFGGPSPAGPDATTEFFLVLWAATSVAGGLVQVIGNDSRRGRWFFGGILLALAVGGVGLAIDDVEPPGWTLAALGLGIVPLMLVGPIGLFYGIRRRRAFARLAGGLERDLAQGEVEVYEGADVRWIDAPGELRARLARASKSGSVRLEVFPASAVVHRVGDWTASHFTAVHRVRPAAAEGTLDASGQTRTLSAEERAELGTLLRRRARDVVLLAVAFILFGARRNQLASWLFDGPSGGADIGIDWVGVLLSAAVATGLVLLRVGNLLRDLKGGVVHRISAGQPGGGAVPVGFEVLPRSEEVWRVGEEPGPMRIARRYGAAEKLR